MNITVELRDQYGTQVFYPICEKAKAFASIAGTKTLTPTVMNLISSLGITVEMTYPTPRGWDQAEGKAVFRKAYCLKQ
jgi:hypothetical protein